MPSTMIHLLVAHESEPLGSEEFWIGSFAPDYTNNTAHKDLIHFRNTPDKDMALKNFKKSIDPKNPFERAWLLHLFTDACWDSSELSAYKDFFLSSGTSAQWFLSYREEISLASYYLYHRLPWARNVWHQIERADFAIIKTLLPINLKEIEAYRNSVVKKHFESTSGSVPKFYTEDALFSFAKITADRYIKWSEG